MNCLRLCILFYSHSVCKITFQHFNISISFNKHKIYTYLMVYQTTSESIRIFKTTIYLKSILDLESIVVLSDASGFDIDLSIAYSFDGVTYSSYDNNIQNIIDDIHSSLFINLVDIKIYFAFKFIITKNNIFSDVSGVKIQAVKINDEEIDNKYFTVEMSQMLEQTIIRTNTNRTFQAYKSNDNAKTLYRELSIGINQMFGFDVIYFRTESVMDSKSITFKMYELSNVIETKKLKISIKDNEIPESLEKFEALEFDFQQELVIHIVKYEFEQIFGIGEKPNSNDFIYLPLTDKMYQLNAPYDPKSFMQYAPFWEVMTTKYEKRASVKGQNSDENFHRIDDIIDFEENYFADEEKFELDDATKQYNKPDQEKNIDKKHIVSAEAPIKKDMTVLYSISTMNGATNESVKTYDFYQDYQDKLLLTSWFKIVNSTGIIFKVENTKNESILIQRSGTNIVSLIIQQEQNTETINFPMAVDKFYGFAMIIDELTFELSFALLNSDKTIAYEYLTNIMKFKENFMKINMYGKIKYSMLRLCKSTNKYTYEDLLFYDVLPETKDFVVIKNATPTLNNK